jgi:hypothetical protein
MKMRILLTVLHVDELISKWVDKLLQFNKPEAYTAYAKPLQQVEQFAVVFIEFLISLTTLHSKTA